MELTIYLQYPFQFKSWDEGMAREAQKWANNCAFEHTYGVNYGMYNLIFQITESHHIIASKVRLFNLYHFSTNNKSVEYYLPFPYLPISLHPCLLSYCLITITKRMICNNSSVFDVG